MSYANTVGSVQNETEKTLLAWASMVMAAGSTERAFLTERGWYQGAHSQRYNIKLAACHRSELVAVPCDPKAFLRDTCNKAAAPGC